MNLRIAHPDWRHSAALSSVTRGMKDTVTRWRCELTTVNADRLADSAYRSDGVDKPEIAMGTERSVRTRRKGTA
jgi:hypothetical protein